MVKVYKRKIPTEVNAIQFNRNDWDELREFTNKKITDLMIPKCPNCEAYCTLKTVNGTHTVTEGDFIVKNETGNFTVLTEDIFNDYYNEIEGL